MTDIEVDLPATWTERGDESQSNSTVVEYERETDERTTFIVSIQSLPRSGEGYDLRLSTIDSTSTHVRHDFSVDEYDTREKAVAEAEDFIELLSRRLREGTVSPAAPEIEAVRETIRLFTGEQQLPSFRSLLRRLW